MSYIGRYRQQTGVGRAIQDFASGKPVLVHDADDREGETDIIYPARSVTPADVTRLRNDAGGLICVALSDKVADEFELPYLADTVDHPTTGSHDLEYDDRSSFSLPVNHRNTRTGITDDDRARTITALGEAVASPGDTDFAAEFRCPGHVPILRAAHGLLVSRHGHTELGIALARKANRVPAVVVCEMLDDETGEALAKTDARHYASRHGLTYIEGARLIHGLP